MLLNILRGTGQLLLLPTRSSVQFSRSVVSDSLRLHGLQHARPPCPSPTPGAYSNSCPLSWWCHPTILSFVIPSPPAFNLSQHQCLFQSVSSLPSGGQSIRVSALASVLLMNIQGWFPLGWTGLISLLSKGLSRVFSNITVQKYQFFSTQLSFGEGNGNPLQYSCLENSVERGAWWAAVYGITQSRTRLKGLSMHACMHWRRKWQPTPLSLPGESQGWRSLVGCCLWDHTESDTTEAT